MVTRTGVQLFSAGLVVLLGAAVWWWITYRDVINYAYLPAADAALCLVGQSSICELARSLCRGAHPMALVSYWWGTFWIGVALASSSLTLAAARR
jgi:hypothetical protein